MKSSKTLLAKLLQLPLYSCAIALLCVGCATGESGQAAGQAAGQQAANASPAPEPGQQVAAAEGERVCRSIRTLGTKMRRSVCRSAEDWRVIDGQATIDKNNQDEFFRRSSEGASLGAPPSYPAAAAPGL